MSSASSSAINLTDFDFGVGRLRLTSREPHDVSVTIRMAGKNRKNANHELVFVPYFKKYRLKFKTVAIGKHKNKAQAPIIVFDHQDLGPESAVIRKYAKLGGIVHSKDHAVKLLSLFKIAIPAQADEVLKAYFKLHPTPVNQNKLNYRICQISLMKTIKNDHETNSKSPVRRKKKIREQNASDAAGTNDIANKSENNIL